MLLISDGVRAVEKRVQEFKNSGEVAYYVKLGNKGAGLVEVSCPLEIWNRIELFDKTYDVEIDVKTSGYKHYLDVVTMAEV